MTDHGETRELLELAAAEPGGMDRLTAGDTPAAMAVAGHVAGCPSCAEELARLRLAGALVAEAVRSTPPPHLRERTLALVREVGRVAAPPVESAGPAATARTSDPPLRGRWAAAVAVLVAAVVGTAVVADRLATERTDRLEARQAALGRVTAAALDLSADPNTARVVLEVGPGAGPGDAEPRGTILFSPTTTELVVVASDLPEPPPGIEYRCWVEVDGRRARVGRMVLGGGLAFWVGPAASVADLPAGARFGVSAVAAGDDGLGGEPVLVGELDPGG